MFQSPHVTHGNEANKHISLNVEIFFEWVSPALQFVLFQLQGTKRGAYPQSSYWHSSLGQGLYTQGQQSQAEPHGVEDGDGGEGLAVNTKSDAETLLDTIQH